MRWFKHMTDASRDSNIVAIRDRWGRAGVCRYWEVLEMIACEMDESDRCEVTYRPGFIARSLGFRSLIDCRSFLEWLALDRGMISVLFANEWTVKCNKLLIIRARKKPIGNRTRTLDIDVEVDKEKKPPKPPKRGSTFPVGFTKFWEAYPAKVGKKAAHRAWIKANINGRLEEILSAVEKQKDSEKWIGGYIPNPATWLNQGRWEDEIGKDPNWKKEFLNAKD